MDELYNKIHKNLCSTNIDETVDLEKWIFDILSIFISELIIFHLYSRAKLYNKKRHAEKVQMKKTYVVFRIHNFHHVILQNSVHFDMVFHLGLLFKNKDARGKKNQAEE